MAPGRIPASKKQALTFSQLSSYDDILTDALVDHVYYWTTVPKNRNSYRPSRGIRADEIAKIIQDEIVVRKDLEAAEKKIVNTAGIKKFISSLRTDKEKQDFLQHLRRYLRIYMPDCPWEVSSTNRYTIVTHEACVTARRYIQRNETIKHLSGIQVTITPEEESQISSTKKDFSIVVSSRKKCTSLFMGPARFANHDCRANARLVTTSQSTIEIVATRAIDVGEEVTVSYSDSYFGEDNCECLCQTCENELRNGWMPVGGTASLISTAGKVEAYSLRRRRRDESTNTGSSRTPSVTRDVRPRVYKTKVKTKLSQEATEEASIPAAPEAPRRGRKRKAAITPPITPSKRLKSAVQSHNLPMPRFTASSSTSSESTRSTSPSLDAPETDATSPEKETPEPNLETPLKNTNTIVLEEEVRDSITVEPYSPQSMDGKPSPVKGRLSNSMSKPQLPRMSIYSILNEPCPEEQRREEPEMQVAPSIEVVDESEIAVPIEKGPEKQSTIKNTGPMPVVPRGRKTGDYELTPLLLSEPDMAWIQCTVPKCEKYFVQQNAYFTRASCPRCERHSKLYGYAWPKTDKLGPSDKEARILDHREVHRFLDPNDERRARGRKLLNGATDAESAGREPQKRGRKPMREHERLKQQLMLEEAQARSSLRRSGRERRMSCKVADGMYRD